MGETILGNSFALGPGGKGSNQAVAAAMCGRRGAFHHQARDAIPLPIWRWRHGQKAGVMPEITQHDDSYTGAAYIFVEEATRQQRDHRLPRRGAARSRRPMSRRTPTLIGGASVFMTQLEQPMEAAHARAGNRPGRRGADDPEPRPGGTDLPDGMLALCDYVTPNESEAEGITGIAGRRRSTTPREAAETLLAKGVGAAIITLGENGALYHDADAVGACARPSTPVRWSKRRARAMRSTAASRRRLPAAWTRSTRCASAAPRPGSRSPAPAPPPPCPHCRKSKPCSSRG